MESKKTIKVIVIDSGINLKHPIFTNRKISAYNVNKSTKKRIPIAQDPIGHGTAICGIICKYAVDIELIFYQIHVDETGQVEENELCDILEYINEHEQGDIINISLGVIQCEKNAFQRLSKLCKEITQKEIIICSAFSNIGYISYPAALECVIGVDSSSECVLHNDIIYVNGNVVNVLGKGSKQRVAWSNPLYIVDSGNSYACAHITSIISNLLSSNNTVDKRNIKQELACLSKREIKNSGFKTNNCELKQQFSIYKAIIFPYNKEMHALVQFQNLLQFDIVDIYDTKFSMNVGKDASREFIGKNIPTKYIKSISDLDWNTFDTLILGHISKISAMSKCEPMINNLIEEMVGHNKNIYSLADISIKKYSRSKIYIPRVNEKDIPTLHLGKMYFINTPVLGIFGTSSEQGKFTLQLSLREYFLKKGIRIGQLGTEPTSPLFEFDQVYPMGYESTVNLCGDNAVYTLNKFMNEIDQKDCDLILAGSQSGTVPYDLSHIKMSTTRQIEFLFGITPDIMILVVNPYDSIEYIMRTIHFLESASESQVIAMAFIPHKLNNKFLSIQLAKVNMTLEETDKYKEYLRSFTNLPAYSIYCTQDMTELAEYIINYLEN